MTYPKSLIKQAKDFLKKNHPTKRIAVVGDVALDRYVNGTVNRIAPEAPIPVFLENGEDFRLGCAANVCKNLSDLSNSVKIDLYGLVAKDSSGSVIKGLVKNLKNVNFDNVGPTSKTTTKTRFMVDGKILFRSDSEVNLGDYDSYKMSKLSKLGSKELLRKISINIKKYDTIIIQDYGKGAITRDLSIELIEEANDLGIKVIVDPNINAEECIYMASYMITPNINEAIHMLYGCSKDIGHSDAEVERLCRDLKDLYKHKVVMITRGKYGLTLLDEGDNSHHFPAIGKQVFDVTGAGDTVVSVFTYALINGAKSEVACLLSIVAASIVVGKVGTSSVTKQEILKELENL